MNKHELMLTAKAIGLKAALEALNADVFNNYFAVVWEALRIRSKLAVKLKEMCEDTDNDDLYKEAFDVMSEHIQGAIYELTLRHPDDLDRTLTCMIWDVIDGKHIPYAWRDLHYEVTKDESYRERLNSFFNEKTLNRIMEWANTGNYPYDYMKKEHIRVEIADYENNSDKGWIAITAPFSVFETASRGEFSV